MRFCRVQLASCSLPIPEHRIWIPEGLQQPSLCGGLHIPRILYAQLRRNNQESKQGHSRAAMPLHYPDHVYRKSQRGSGSTEALEARGVLGSEGQGQGCPLLRVQKQKRRKGWGHQETSGKKRRYKGKIRAWRRGTVRNRHPASLNGANASP